jgi:diguanylate cyclase (GGDEF)-like protein
LAVACGLLLGGLAERVRSKRHVDRIAVLLCSSWHSVGPAVVVGFYAPGPPSWSRAPVYAAALLAQFAFDDAAVVVRHRFGRGVPVRDLISPLALVAIVDLALAPLALLVAFVVVADPLAVLAVLPVAGLLHALGIDRRRRIDESVALGRAIQDASREARVDPLTGIGNRLAWQEAIEAAGSRLARSGEAASILLVDLDRLKEANDRFGHDAGDRLIRRLAAVLGSIVPERTTLARIGGDEFAVLALGLDEQGSDDLMRTIRLALETLEVGGITASASLGASSCPPCTSLDEALRLADERLYGDKAAA